MELSSDNRIERATTGDDDALVSLLEEASPALSIELERKISARHRGAVEPDDILQVTFLEAFLRVRSFAGREPAAFFAWLRRIATNNMLDAIKELERDKRPPPGQRVVASAEEASAAFLERLAATTTTPSRICARDELRKSVEDALRQLPADYERALRLYELEGLSAPEVAERMGRRHGAVRMLLARARDRLAELLSGGFSSQA